MNISSKRFRKIKYKIKNQSAKKYKHYKNKKKGGFRSRKKNIRYNLKNKSMKNRNKIKMQKGGVKNLMTLTDIVNIAPAMIGTPIILKYPIPMYLTTTNFNDDKSEKYNIDDIKLIQTEIESLQTNITTATKEMKQNTGTGTDKKEDLKTAMTKYKENNKLLESIEDKIDRSIDIIEKNMKYQTNNIKSVTANPAKIINVMISGDKKLVPFYSSLLNNDIMIYDNDTQYKMMDYVKKNNNIFKSLSFKNLTSHFNVSKTIDNAILDNIKTQQEINKLTIGGNKQMNKVNDIGAGHTQTLDVQQYEKLLLLHEKTKQEDIQKPNWAYEDEMNKPDTNMSTISNKQNEIKKKIKKIKEDINNIQFKVTDINDMANTNIKNVDNFYKISDNNSSNQYIHKLENAIINIIEKATGIIRLKISEIKTKINKKKGELKKKGLMPNSIKREKDGKIEFGDPDDDSISTKFEKDEDGNLYKVDPETGERVSGALTEEQAQKLAEKENSNKKDQKFRDEKGLNIYLPQTELAEKETLYYNINLNQKRKNLFGETIPNTNYNTWKHNLYGPAQSTTLGWLLHGPKNLGLDRVEGEHKAIKIDERGKYIDSSSGFAQDITEDSAPPTLLQKAKKSIGKSIEKKIQAAKDFVDFNKADRERTDSIINALEAQNITIKETSKQKEAREKRNKENKVEIPNIKVNETMRPETKSKKDDGEKETKKQLQRMAKLKGSVDSKELQKETERLKEGIDTGTFKKNNSLKEKRMKNSKYQRELNDLLKKEKEEQDTMMEKENNKNKQLQLAGEIEKNYKDQKNKLKVKYSINDEYKDMNNTKLFNQITTLDNEIKDMGVEELKKIGLEGDIEKILNKVESNTTKPNLISQGKNMIGEKVVVNKYEFIDNALKKVKQEMLKEQLKKALEGEREEIVNALEFDLKSIAEKDFVKKYKQNLADKNKKKLKTLENELQEAMEDFKNAKNAKNNKKNVNTNTPEYIKILDSFITNKKIKSGGSGDGKGKKNKNVKEKPAIIPNLNKKIDEYIKVLDQISKTWKKDNSNVNAINNKANILMKNLKIYKTYLDGMKNEIKTEKEEIGKSNPELLMTPDQLRKQNIKKMAKQNENRLLDMQDNQRIKQ
jgi:hypothetical protein